MTETAEKKPIVCFTCKKTFPADDSLVDCAQCSTTHCLDCTKKNEEDVGNCEECGETMCSACPSQCEECKEGCCLKCSKTPCTVCDDIKEVELLCQNCAVECSICRDEFCTEHTSCHLIPTKEGNAFVKKECNVCYTCIESALDTMIMNEERRWAKIRKQQEQSLKK